MAAVELLASSGSLLFHVPYIIFYIAHILIPRAPNILNRRKRIPGTINNFDNSRVSSSLTSNIPSYGGSSIYRRDSSLLIACSRLPSVLARALREAASLNPIACNLPRLAAAVLVASLPTFSGREPLSPYDVGCFRPLNGKDGFIVVPGKVIVCTVK
jgi:hypothetical protein